MLNSIIRFKHKLFNSLMKCMHIFDYESIKSLIDVETSTMTICNSSEFDCGAPLDKRSIDTEYIYTEISFAEKAKFAKLLI